MKKTTKPIAVVTAALLFAITVNAENIKDDFQIILKKYSENSPSYEAAELRCEKNKAGNYSNEYSLKSVESSIEENEMQLKSLEYQLSGESDYYEKESLRTNIEYRQIYAFELEFNKAELELEAAFGAVTEEYSQTTLESEKIRLEYEIRSKLNSFTALKKQLAYLELQQQYYTENVEIIKSSLEIGYATQLDLENAKAQLAASKAQIAECKMQIEQCQNDISLNSGEAIQEYSHVYLKKCDINKDELLEQFREVSPQDKILEKQVQAYLNLIRKIKDINKQLNEYMPKENKAILSTRIAFPNAPRALWHIIITN